MAQQVKQARAEHAAARSAATADLIKAFDAQSKAATAAGNLEGSKALASQKEAFTASGALPASPLMRDAAATYVDATRKADARLADALETGIEQYTRQSKVNEGMELRRERRLLLEGKDAVAAAPGAPGPAGSSADVAARLAGSKQEYGQAVADAKQAMLAAIDGRIASATGAGDLKAVESVRAARASAEAGGSVPEETHDPGVLAAKRRYDAAVQAANTRLSLAYQEAVRGYTRAGKIPEAEATQKEFDGTGLAAGGAGVAGEGGATVYRLAKNLPAFLVADAPFAVEKDGIRPKDGTYIRSKSGNFLGKDFTFDVWFTQPKHGPPGYIGIGEGAAKWHEPEYSVILKFHPVDLDHGKFVLTRSPQHEGQTLCDLSEPGPYMARIEKRGNTLTVSVGTEKDEKYTPIKSRVVPDLHDYAPWLNERNTHVFIGGGQEFNKVRFVVGSAPPAAPTAAAPAVQTTPVAVAAAAAPAAPATAPAAARPAVGSPAPAAAVVGKLKTVNLLASVNPATDAVHGKWALTKEGIRSDAARDASLQFSYHPPAEYDLAVSFTPLVANDCVNVVAVLNGQQFQLNLASKNAWGGLDSVRNMRAFDARNPTRTAVKFEPNRKYALVLHVRKTGVSASLDGKPLVDYKTDGSDLKLIDKWRLRDGNALGIQSGDTPTLFHSVEVTELN